MPDTVLHFIFNQTINYHVMPLLQIKWDGITQSQIPVTGKTFEQLAKELENRFHTDPNVAIIEHQKIDRTKSVLIRSSTRKILDMYKLVP